MQDLTTEYWTYKQSPDLPPEPEVDYDILDANGELIAVVFQRNNKDKTERLAKLVAAAPDMYAYLKRVLSTYQSIDILLLNDIKNILASIDNTEVQS